MTTSGSFEDTLRVIVRDVVRVEIRNALDERAARDARRNGARTPTADSYLSIAGASALADVAPGTLRRWIKDGRLPTGRAGRVYRIKRSDLEALLAHATPAITEQARAIVTATR